MNKDFGYALAISGLALMISGIGIAKRFEYEEPEFILVGIFMAFIGWLQFVSGHFIIFPGKDWWKQ